jgi:UDPglucose 6-dehydrogenase/GDP-mannose 6-dehydrogenase
MRISIIGTGYVGLVTGVCLAEKGHEVVCVDVDRAKVETINAGIPTIHEAGLAPLLGKHLGRRFRATTDLTDAVTNTEVSFIAVGTPFNGQQIDLQCVREAAAQLGEILRGKQDFHVVVFKSTVIPGTTQDVVLPILEESSGKRAGDGLGVGMNPEFLREGCAVEDFLSPDRIVLGAVDDRTLSVLEEVYLPFRNVELIRTTTQTAEMIKYASNSLLATLISFSNEIGNLCASLEEVDAMEVMRGVHMDKRLSPVLEGRRIIPGIAAYLSPGCGFGGSCFPKDLKALISFGENSGVPMRLLNSVVAVNQCQPERMIKLLEKHFPVLHGVRVSVLGLAFKPGTDDMRESPALPVLSALLAAQARIKAYDPVVRRDQIELPGIEQITVSRNLSEAMRDSQAVLVVTQWPEFNDLEKHLAGLAEPPLVIDGRRMLKPHNFARYEGIGFGKPRESAMANGALAR